MPTPGKLSLLRISARDERGRVVQLRLGGRVWLKAPWSWHRAHWQFWACIALFLTLTGLTFWAQRVLFDHLAAASLVASVGPPSRFDILIVLLSILFPWGTMLAMTSVLHLVFQRVCVPGLAQRRVDEGACPSCAYQLRGLAPDADGCTPCPECGAAWRVSTAEHTPPV